jgi:hypothetical protein
MIFFILELIYLDDFGFGAQLGDQGRHVRHFDAGRAFCRLGHFQGLQARGHVDAQVFRLVTSSGFFLAFMMFGRVT